MVFEETLRQEGEIGFVVYVNSVFFFTFHMSKTVGFNRFTRVCVSNLRNNRYRWLWYVNRSEPLRIVAKPLWIVAKPPQCIHGIYYEYILKDRSRKSGFYGWQLFPRTVALSVIACVMPDFCCWVKSLHLLSAKSLRRIPRIEIYTDVNLGLYFVVLSYKLELLFSKLCGFNLCLARPLNAAEH